MSRPEIQRLGIIRLSSIGDVVHAMPLANGLRRNYPDARITWVVQEESAPLVEGHPAVDEVLLYPRRGGPGAYLRFVKELRARGFQAVVDPQGNAKSGVVARLSGARIRSGLNRRDCKEWVNVLFSNRRGPPSIRPHGVDRSWAAASLLLDPGPDDWGLAARPEEIADWQTRGEAAGIDAGLRLLAINLTDPADPRSWFSESWAALSHLAAERGFQVLLNGPAARRPVAAEILASGPSSGVFDLTGRDDLRGLLAQMQWMSTRPGDVLVSGDSGPVHMAVAVGLRVVCLSGPQDPERTGPRAGCGVAVHAWEGLPCAPCIERKCIRKPPDRACMRQLDATRVMQAIDRICAEPDGSASASAS